jgi:D-3-phosphoglycerate dehydrogenase / 2-oxoglutarate reductase
MPESIQGVRLLRPRFQKALVLEEPDPSLDKYLTELGICVDRLGLELTERRDEVLRTLREGQHDLIFKRSRFEVDEEVIEASDNLAAVMLCCIGDDSVDKRACARRGVMVMNDPISNGRSVVEMVMGEMICLARRIFEADREGRRHLWTKHSQGRFELKGKNLSLIGLGNIGKQVAQVAESFGLNVYFYDTRELAREVGEALGWKACDSLTEAFRVADAVSVHVSAEDSRGRSNREMITYEHFRQLAADRNGKSPRIFINAARGFLYDPEDLKRALHEGHVERAAVDVFPTEPGSREDRWVNPFAEEVQVISTPHIGAATEEAQPRIALHMANTTRLFNRYGTVRDCVFSPGQTIGVDAEKAATILTVIHSDQRGTKKAVDDAIYEAGLNNLESSHRDFPDFGFAYEVSAIDRPLNRQQLRWLVSKAAELTGDPKAIRVVRQVPVPEKAGT